MITIGVAPSNKTRKRRRRCQLDVVLRMCEHVAAFMRENDARTSEAYLSAIRLPQAWDLSHGSPGVVVAVVDTGVTAVGDVSTQIIAGRNFVAGNADAAQLRI